MLWQPDYMPRVQIGLPQVDLDGARLLAHTFLFEIDRLLVSKTQLEYARFMDDMAIGADNIVEAREIVRDLDLALQTRQLRLNSGKTKILSSAEAHRYYRIDENIALDKLESRLNNPSEPISNVNKYKNMISQVIRRGLKRGRFTDGNGEKILRRLINYFKHYRVKLGHKSFSEILYNWPSCRGLILSWWYEYIKPDGEIKCLGAASVSFPTCPT
jgi:hypothetical protein